MSKSACGLPLNVWQDEATGYWCAIIQGPLSVNGYVHIPVDHPWYRKHYWEHGESSCQVIDCRNWQHAISALAPVHGTITFAASGSVLGLEWDWCFGFDTCHSDDYVEAYEQLDVANPYAHGIKWSHEMVQEETKRLATELKRFAKETT